MCVEVHMCAYGGQRTTLAAASQVPSTLLIKTGSLIVCYSPGRAGWLKSPWSFYLPSLGLQACVKVSSSARVYVCVCV